MTDTANAFLFRDIQADMRAQALQRLTDQRPGHYLPSPKLYKYYQHLMSLPRSNSDDSGVVAAIKTDARSGANDTLSSSQSGTADATNTLTQNNDQAAFIARMEESRQETQMRVAATINKTYDLAEAEGGSIIAAAAALAAYVSARANLNTVANRIDTFVQTATTMSAEDWIEQGPGLSSDFYQKLSSFVQGAFN